MTWTYKPSDKHTGYCIFNERGELIATIHHGLDSEKYARIMAASRDLLDASESVIGFGDDLASFKAYARLQLAVKKARE